MIKLKIKNENTQMNNKSTQKILIIFLLLVLIFMNSSVGTSQDNALSPQTIFDRISFGIENNELNVFSDYFSSQVYLSLNTGEKGYYSKSQVYYILQNYFSIYKPTNFKVSSKLLSASNPYFAGKFNYDFKGKRGLVKVYVSLTLIESRWEITQITFN